MQQQFVVAAVMIKLFGIILVLNKMVIYMLKNAGRLDVCAYKQKVPEVP
jgi:hypothetical protein